MRAGFVVAALALVAWVVWPESEAPPIAAAGGASPGPTLARATASDPTPPGSTATASESAARKIDAPPSGTAPATERASRNDPSSAAPPDPREEERRIQRERLFGRARAEDAELLLSLTRARRYEELAFVAEATLERDRGFTLAWAQAGIAHAKLGNLERARELLEVVRERAPREPDPAVRPYYRAALFTLAAIEDG